MENRRASHVVRRAQKHHTAVLMELIKPLKARLMFSAAESKALPCCFDTYCNSSATKICRLKFPKRTARMKKEVNEFLVRSMSFAFSDITWNRDSCTSHLLR